MTTMTAHLNSMLAQQAVEHPSSAPHGGSRPAHVVALHARALKTDSMHFQSVKMGGHPAHVAAVPSPNRMQADAARLVATGALPTPTGFRATPAAASLPRGMRPASEPADEAAHHSTQAAHHASLAVDPQLRYQPLIAAQNAAAARLHSGHGHAHHTRHLNGAHMAEIAHQAGVKHLPATGGLQEHLGRLAAAVPVASPEAAMTRTSKVASLPPQLARIRDVAQASPFTDGVRFTATNYAVSLPERRNAAAA